MLDLCIQVTNITGKWLPRSKESNIPNGSDALLGVTQLVATYDKVTSQLEEIKSELHEVMNRSMLLNCTISSNNIVNLCF